MNAASKSQIVECPKCGAKNRVAETSAGREPVCGRCKTPLKAEGEPVKITDRNFAETVEKSSLPVLVDFWAAWCAPCRAIAPALDALAKELAGRAKIGKLNVDENKMSAARFGVQGIPTLIIFKNGNEVERLVGVQSKEALARRLSAHM